MSLAHVPSEMIRPIKLVEYERLAEAGAFDGERVELLYGRIVKMPPQGTPHSYGITQLAELLTTRLIGRAKVRVQMPFLGPHESMPEPDVALVASGDYLDAHPSEAHLVVELADTSLAIDRAKTLIYAHANITEYWIVDVNGGVIEVYRDPSESGFTSVTRHARGDEIAVPHFADVIVPVAHVLPPPK